MARVTNSAVADADRALRWDLRGPAFVAILLIVACAIVWLNAAMADGSLFGDDPCAGGQSGTSFENPTTGTTGTLCFLDD